MIRATSLFRTGSASAQQTRCGGIRVAAHQGSGTVHTELNLQGAQHLGDRLLLAADEKHVVEDDGATFVAGVQNQPARSQQHVFKDVVDFGLGRALF